MAVIGTKQHDMVDSQVDDPTLPDYRAMAVADCIAFAQSRIDANPGCTVLREEYLPIDDEVIVAGGVPFTGTTAGYLDIGLVTKDGRKAEVIDWKFGNNAVEDAGNNVQGMAYALGLLKRFPDLQEITVTFIMPHLDHQSQHTFTRDQFDGMRWRIVTIVRRSIEAAKNPDDFSLATPNSSSCRFCALIGRCPKVAEKVLSVGKKYAPLKIPNEITPSLICDPAQTKLGMQVADIVITWAEAYKRQASAKAIDDPNCFVPDGYVLVQTSKRIVKDARKLGELAKEYLPPEDKSKVDALYDIPIGKCEKLISTAAPRGSKEATIEEFGLAALATGALEQGTPFAFLRQERKTDSGKVSNKD